MELSTPCTAAEGSWPNEGVGAVGMVKCCLAHLSPVVIDNDGALLIIHGDCAHITLP